MADDKFKVVAVVTVLRGGIGHGDAFGRHFPSADVQRETVGMGLAESPEAVGQGAGGHGGRPHRLCSLTSRPASHKREQGKPEAGLFEFFNHSNCLFCVPKRRSKGREKNV